MPRRKQNRPMRVGEEGSSTSNEMEPGPSESNPDTDIVINKDDAEQDEGKQKRRRSSSSSFRDSPPQSSAATLSTFAPLDLSIKKSSSSSRQTPSPIPLRMSTGSPTTLPINGSSGTNHGPITQLPSNFGTTPPKSGKGLMKVSGGTRGSGSRQNPWQTQWMNRSSEQTRDVFTCVWCKESFKSLQDMTLHMKKSPRCGMAGMQQAAAATASLSSALSSSSSQSSSSHNHPVPSSPLLSHHLPIHHPHISSSASGANGSIGKGGGGRNTVTSSSGNSNSHSKSVEPMSSAVLAKNNVALPRKLVRGQDVWLGRGAEQTRQILKCMWCAQSFKSLDEMTRHMRITQHYTNIISQEQIISWRTPEDKVAQAQVNAVLTCKVCDEAFGSLKELSYHMVKNAHYKEHILRSITEGGHGRRRQTRERRKKSLPVRKLLELERMEIVPPSSSDPSNTKVSASSSTKSTSEKVSSRDSDTPNNVNKGDQRGSATSTPSLSSSSSITCDECSEQVEGRHFISHLKECIKQHLTSATSATLQSDSNLTRSPKSIPRSPDSISTSGRPSGPPSRCQTESPSSITEAVNTHLDRPHLKKENRDESSEQSEMDDVDEEGEEAVEEADDDPRAKKDLSSRKKKGEVSSQEPLSTTQSSSSACLSALENLIEKSFDTKSSTPRTSSSSQRLDKSHRHGSSGHHHHSKSSKLSSTSAMSNVEKWMTLAKERDGPNPYSAPNNVWSPSMSSSSNSSWNHGSDDEEKGGSNALVVNFKRGGNNHEKDDLRSPSSSASADSRPGSSAIQVKRSRSPVGKVSSLDSRSKLKRMKVEAVEDEKRRNSRNTPISKLDSEEERREEIEELKRSGGVGGLKAESPINSAATKNTSSESLSALERLIEKSFDSKKKNTPTGFLQRLGIDEEVCPPWQPGLLAAALPFGHPFQPWLIPKLSVPQDSRSSSSSPAKTNKNGSICSSPPAT